MGAGYHGGFGNTKGNRDRKEQEKQTLIQELKSKGIKFTEQDIVFITKDKTGQTIWLEKGSASAGLQHIIQRHEIDYKNVYCISKDNIPNYIKSVIENATLVNQNIVVRNGKSGIERIYEYNDTYYTLMALGTNGFIISMYPQKKR